MVVVVVARQTEEVQKKRRCTCKYTHTHTEKRHIDRPMLTQWSCICESLLYSWQYEGGGSGSSSGSIGIRLGHFQIINPMIFDRFAPFSHSRSHSSLSLSHSLALALSLPALTTIFFPCHTFWFRLATYILRKNIYILYIKLIMNSKKITRYIDISYCAIFFLFLARFLSSPTLSCSFISRVVVVVVVVEVVVVVVVIHVPLSDLHTGLELGVQGQRRKEIAGGDYAVMVRAFFDQYCIILRQRYGNRSPRTQHTIAQQTHHSLQQHLDMTSQLIDVGERPMLTKRYLVENW